MAYSQTLTAPLEVTPSIAGSVSGGSDIVKPDIRPVLRSVVCILVSTDRFLAD